MTAFIRQFLTYKDDPRTERNKIFVISNIGIQMNQKELTKTFYWNKHSGLHDLYKIYSAL